MWVFFRIKDRFKRRAGASLVEMLIAIIITAFILLGLMAAMIIFKGTVTSKEEAGARMVALNTLEALESCRLTDIAARDITSPQGIYTVVRTLNPAVINAGTASVDVTVTVSWSNGAKSVVLRREVSSSGWQNVGVLP